MGLRAIFHRNCVGVELLDGEIRLAEVRGSGRRVRVAHTASRQLPAGLVAAGEVQDPAALGEEIRGACQEGGIRCSRVVLAAPDSRLLCRTLTVPPVRDRDLTGLVEYEVEQNLHIPFQNPVWDYAATPLARGSESRSVLVTAVPGQVVERLTGAAAAGGLKPVAMEITPLALHRLLGSVCPTEDLRGALMVVQLSTSSLGLHIFQGPLLIYTRFAALELPAKDGWGSSATPAGDLVAAAAAAEMEQALRFYLYSLNGRTMPVEQIWLVGGVGGTAQIAAGLSHTLDLPVQPLPPRGVLTGFPEEELHRYAAAIGLALKGVAA